MPAQVRVAAHPPIPEFVNPAIDLPSGFSISSQDHRLGNLPAKSIDLATPPLGVLENFTGTFTGTGFNLIFRPNSGQTKFPNPLDPNLPPPPNPPNENVLELNLTSETLSFSNPLGEVPNRGLEKQIDIFLNGVPYVQNINDVTNVATDPVLPESLTRMASIPHGATINAQCLAPTASSPGPPPFTGPNALPAVDITPFVIGDPTTRIKFASQTVSATNTPRLPQDLTNFINAGTITQAILDNPNLILANAIQGQNITNTIVFTVSTTPTAPLQAGGTANIAFLQGSSAGIQSGPNASAVSMSATFWIETVQHDIQLPAFKHGDTTPMLIQNPPASPGIHAGPTFRVHPPLQDIQAPKKSVTVTSKQIQYMQTVFLNFAGLTWPHVSCATLVPNKPVDVPAEAFR